ELAGLADLVEQGTGARRQLSWLEDHGDIGGLMREIVAASRPDARAGKARVRTTPSRTAPRRFAAIFETNYRVLGARNTNSVPKWPNSAQWKASSTCSADAGR